jgi:pimeloyl-ACP methyl ester carboxylesterase
MLMFICLLSAGAVTLMCGGIAEGRPLTRGNRERGYVMPLSPPKLNLKEEHFRVASYIEGLTLFLRYLPPTAHHTDTPKIVLYVHGGSFPSALSIAHRFDGRSWRDELADAGFHVWGLDFHGFGASDRYLEMAEPAERNPVPGRAEAASQQIERAVGFIRDHDGVPRISIIAHSWGTIAAGRFAGRCPDFVERLVFFGPVTWRQKKAEPQTFAAWRLVSLKDQWDRFTAEVPSQEPPVLSKPHFKEWISLHGHRPGQPDSLASERQDAKRAVAGHSHLGSW